MFYFQQLLNTALAGIDGTAIVSDGHELRIRHPADRFSDRPLSGGVSWRRSARRLRERPIKYLVVAMIVSNWATVFRGVNGSFNTIANSIGSSSGAGDMFQSWMGQLQQQFANNPSLTLTDIITGDAASTITVVLLVVAYLLYALAMIVFCFFYTLFGAILYVVGPLVLALIPIPGVGQLGKSYAVNVMIWNAWGILYAVFGALITAIQVNQVNNILGNGFLGFLKGAGDSVMLGLVSIFYALAIALIPFIAKRIISGDVGSTAFALVRAGGVAAGAALAGISGFAAGASSAFDGRYSIGWCGRFVHFHYAGLVNTAACSFDARFHSLGSCERDEQQQQSRGACSQRKRQRKFWYPRCSRCHVGQRWPTWVQLSTPFGDPSRQF